MAGTELPAGREGMDIRVFSAWLSGSPAPDSAAAPSRGAGIDLQQRPNRISSLSEIDDPL